MNVCFGEKLSQPTFECLELLCVSAERGEARRKGDSDARPVQQPPQPERLAVAAQRVSQQRQPGELRRHRLQSLALEIVATERKALILLISTVLCYAHLQNEADQLVVVKVELL